jgi:peptide/nickel transport system ATP-binding protein
MTTEAKPVLEVDGLSVDFITDRGWTNVIDNVSFSVAPGETLGIVGESGSGKSVTSLAVMGLLPQQSALVSSGSIRLLGEELTSVAPRRMEDIRGNEMAMIFQEPMTSLNPAFKVGFQIAESVRRHTNLSKSQAMERAVEVLDLVGIPNPRRRAQSYPHEFSGGMRQRAMIAMAISCNPQLLIADEPTTALDVTIQAQVLELLDQMRRDLGVAIIFITHDLGVVAEVCDRVLVMYAGQIVEQSPIEPLFRSPHHPYTEGLLVAMPQVGLVGEELASIPGSPPVPWDLPDGCRFRPRCGYEQAQCANPVSLVAISSDVESRCVRLSELDLRGVQ